MNFIVNPNTFEKYSIFSKDGTLLLKKYVKLYQSGGAKQYKRNISEMQQDTQQDTPVRQETRAERMNRKASGGKFRSPPEDNYPPI